MEAERGKLRVSRRAFLASAAAAVGGTLLAACGGTSPTATTARAGGAATAPAGGTAPAAGGGKEVTLRWYMWTATDAEKQVWEDLAADVTKAHPNIKVTFETDAFASYWD